MNCTEPISPVVDVEVHMKNLKVDSHCQVCGSEHAQIHYGGICCVSCKMFFRRNADFNLNTHQCVFNEICDITMNSRRACRYCRLQKCLDIGMQRELLRAAHHRPEKIPVEKNPLPSNVKTTMELFMNDHSILTEEQWRVLSNIINVYNTKSPVSHIRYLLTVQSKTPLKIRFKQSKTDILDIISSTYQSILPFIETLPEFQCMQTYDRCHLIERNLAYVGAFNGIVVFRDAEVTLSTAFKNGFPSIYGNTIVDDSTKIAHRTDNDLTLIKLLIPIILFSTSFSVNVPRNVNNNSGLIADEINSIFCNSQRLLYIQNIYVEIMFKYMIYRFGYNEASLRFAALIKSFLDQSMCVQRANEIQTHDELLQTLVKETETVLTIHNEPIV